MDEQSESSVDADGAGAEAADGPDDEPESDGESRVAASHTAGDDDADADGDFSDTDHTDTDIVTDGDDGDEGGAAGSDVGTGDDDVAQPDREVGADDTGGGDADGGRDDAAATDTEASDSGVPDYDGDHEIPQDPPGEPSDFTSTADMTATDDYAGMYGNVSVDDGAGTAGGAGATDGPDLLDGEFVAAHADAATAASVGESRTAVADGAVASETADDPGWTGDANTTAVDFTENIDTGIADTEFEGPQEDQEMPLADHIEEMVRRLGIVLAVVGVVMVVVFPVADGLINYLWNTHIPGATSVADRRPRLYGPLELLLTEIKVAGLAGFVLGLPVFVYQTYRFMRPGLYPNERRYYLAAVPTSLVLAVVGVAFAHFVVLPAIFAYFTAYTTGTAVVAFGLKETFRLILLLMGYMALVFQIPLFMMLGIMMGLVSRQWYTEKRLLFWGGFLGVSFLISPDPTGMAPIIIAITMISLFEGTLLLLRWTKRGDRKRA